MGEKLFEGLLVGATVFNLLLSCKALFMHLFIIVPELCMFQAGITLFCVLFCILYYKVVRKELQVYNEHGSN